MSWSASAPHIQLLPKPSVRSRQASAARPGTGGHSSALPGPASEIATDTIQPGRLVGCSAPVTTCSAPLRSRNAGNLYHRLCLPVTDFSTSGQERRYSIAARIMSSCPARARSEQRYPTAWLMITVLHLITGLETGGAEGMLARLVTRTDRSRFHPVVVSMTDSGAVGPVIAGAGIPV